MNISNEKILQNDNFKFKIFVLMATLIEFKTGLE